MTKNKKILKHIPRNVLPQIASEFGMNRSTLYRKLQKEEWSHPAVLRLIELAKEVKHEKIEIEKQIKSL